MHGDLIQHLQVGGRQPCRERCHAIRRVWHGRRERLAERCLADQSRQFLQGTVQGHATAGERVGGSQRCLGIALAHRLQDGEQRIEVGHAEHLCHRRREHASTAKSDRLIEQRQRVAQTALRRTREQIERRWFRLDTLFGEDVCHARSDDRGGDGLEAELHAAAQDRHRDLLRIGGGKHEFDVIRRLLEGLEHGVERRARELVHLVDHIHLEAPSGRCVSGVLKQLAHAIDLGVGSRIQLDEVDEAPLLDTATGCTYAAGVGRDAGLTVECARQHARQRGLSHPAGASEEIGVMQAAARQGMPQGLQHMRLADHIGEGVRPPLSGEDAMRLHGLDYAPAGWAGRCPGWPQPDGRKNKRGAAAPLRPNPMALETVLEP